MFKSGETEEIAAGWGGSVFPLEHVKFESTVIHPRRDALSVKCLSLKLRREVLIRDINVGISVRAH